MTQICSTNDAGNFPNTGFRAFELQGEDAPSPHLTGADSGLIPCGVARNNAGRPARSRASQPAFTLVEMLAVITIIAILMALAGPVMFKGVSSSKLTGAGERMLGTLSEAQQMAFTKSSTFEIRFYKYDGLIPGGSAGFRGYQLFKIATAPGTNTETATKITECVKFPDGVMISESIIFSPVLSGTPLPDTDNNASVKIPATYVALRFLPDGTCRKIDSATGEATAPAVMTFPDTKNSFLTLLADDGKTYGATNMPKNFYAIQTDPYTGKSRSYRPGI